jgi:hypothetical protein
MQKDYHLINERTGEKAVVHPPFLPGENADGKNPKNKDGHWIRRFTVVDAAGIPAFQANQMITLTHCPGNLPSAIFNGDKWQVRPIPDVKAVRQKRTVIAPGVAVAPISQTADQI